VFVLKGFFEFIREQGIVGLAIGFILGGAVSKLVSALVEDLINPILGIILGAVGGLDKLVLRLGPAQIKYGSFIGSMIDFIVIAFVVYYIFKGLQSKLDIKK
jgi:large conductance mechanosensitive channel